MDPPALPLGLTTGATTLNPTTANAIDTHMREIASLRDPLLGCSQGDVLAIVRFPRDDSAVACDTRPWQDVRLLMRYEQLVGLGSNKIRAMFTPRAQARFRRLLGGEPLAPGVEYVVDFTPPTEGLELAELTAALWLPKMVKLWFLAGQYMPEPILGRPMDQPMRPMANKAVGSILALGHDDVCKSPSCLADFSEWQVKDGLPGIVDENPALGPSHIPPFRKVEDYCPIRHRVAIVRVLRAVNGHGLLLNSAVRMWTVAQVAIYLEVPQVVVDPVTQWLVAPPNTKFIEICPEKAFQLAYALKIPSVLIASFKILVNELAIDYAASEPSPRRQPLTWAQRRRDDYGDYPSDPVEYASRAFAERMSAMLRMLLSDDVFDKLPQRIPEWDKLQYLGSLIDAHGPDVLRTSYQNLTASLLAAFHKSVQVALGFESFTSQLGPLIEAQRKHYIADADRTRLEALYTQLNPCQKALTPFFWDQLMWTPTETEFCATVDNGRQLRRHASSFNTLLRSALDNGTIVPDQTHPSLQPAAYPVSREPDLEFNLVRLHGSLRAEVKAICAHILRNNLRDSDSNGVPFFLSDHLLLALDEPELNYLPIWADGLEDGSGGVFQEAIPPAEMGPSELGPGYHTGCTVGTETETATDADDADTTRGCGGATSQAGAGGGYDYASTIALSDLGVGVLALGDDEDDDHMMDGTVAASATAAGRSMRAHRSTTTTAATTTTTTTGAARSGAAPSETFTADDGSSVYADARFAEPAAHQAQGQAIEQYVAEAEGSGAWMGEDDEDGFAGDSDEEMGFSDDGSSTLDGFEELDFAEEP